LVEKLIKEIQLEIALLDDLFVHYADLFTTVQQSIPNLVEVTALGSVVHSFYSGLENVFSLIARRIDGQLPNDPNWHRVLLAQMATTTDQRPALLSTDLHRILSDYLGFRHFYRHGYSYFLDWDKLERLVMPMPVVWEQTKQALTHFLTYLEGSST
jgi:hypothetical protein